MLHDVIPYYTCFKRKALHVLLYKFPPGQTFAQVPTGKQSCPWASYLCLGAKVTNWSEEQPQSEPAEDGSADFESSGQESNISGGTELPQQKSGFYPQSNSQNTHQKCRIFTVVTTVGEVQ